MYTAGGTSASPVVATIPPHYEKYFSCGVAADAMFFSEVLRVNRRGLNKKRCIVVTEDAILLCTHQGTVNRRVPLRDIDKVIVSPSGLDCLFTVPASYDLFVRFPSATLVSHSLIPTLKQHTYLRVMPLAVGQAIGDPHNPINFGGDNEPERDKSLRLPRSPQLPPATLSPPQPSSATPPAPAASSDEEPVHALSFAQQAARTAQRSSRRSPARPSSVGSAATHASSLRRRGASPDGTAASPAALPLWNNLRSKSPRKSGVGGGVGGGGWSPRMVRLAVPTTATETQTDPVSEMCPGCHAVAQYGCASWCPSMWYSPLQEADAGAPALGQAGPRAAASGGTMAFDVSEARGVRFTHANTRASRMKNLPVVLMLDWAGTPAFLTHGVVRYGVAFEKDLFQRCALGVTMGSGWSYEFRTDGALLVNGNIVAHHAAGAQQDSYTLVVDRSLHKRISLEERGTGRVLASAALEGAALVADLHFHVRLHNSGDAARLLEYKAFPASPEVVAYAAAALVACRVVGDKGMWTVRRKLQVETAENTALKDIVADLSRQKEALRTESRGLAARAAAAEREAEAQATALREERRRHDALRERQRRSAEAAHAQTAAGEKLEAAAAAEREGATRLAVALAEAERRAEAQQAEARQEAARLGDRLAKAEAASAAAAAAAVASEDGERGAARELAGRVVELEEEVRALAQRNKGLALQAQAERVRDDDRGGEAAVAEVTRRVAGLLDGLVLESPAHEEALPPLPSQLAILMPVVERLRVQRRNEHRIVAMSKSRPGLVVSATLAGLASGDYGAAAHALRTQCPSVPEAELRQVHCQFAAATLGLRAEVSAQRLLLRYYGKLRWFPTARRNTAGR